MLVYYGSKITENRNITPEGYLICMNVPIGRVGYMEYNSNEVPTFEGITFNNTVKVFRTEEELFNQVTMASFEGKPVTRNHPKKMVDINSINMDGKGHAQNVRRVGDELIADLIIQDPILIDDIQIRGVREVSCGYECDWIPYDDGTIEQKKIIGNHVAIVPKGRAGSRIAIKDHLPNNERSNEQMDKPKNKLAKIFGMGFKQFALDAEPEELASMMMDEESSALEKQEAGQNSEILAAVKALTETVTGLADRLTKLEESDKTVHEELGAEDVFNEMEKEETLDPAYDEEKEETEMSKLVEDAELEEKEEPEEKTKMSTGDAAYMAAKKAILSIPDEKTRTEVAKQFKAAMDSSSKSNNTYGDIVKSAVETKQKAAKDSAEKFDVNAAAKAAYDKVGEQMRKRG